ncbi:SPFH domain-containing protein [Streptomyces exfoliatus]|uniref:SPFH domain-containing protein n=1 Tax=Streptomyces exfoliatus TaxID=1905 RepID=UPI001FDEDBC1|nr:SPFH domain-containing protein [Streptomyces exfoliatus]
MTASPPNPADSGAAASRDAARTARRLTDGTLPRTSPPQGAPPGTPPGPAPQDPAAAPDGTEEVRATGSEAAVAVAVAGGAAEAPAAGAGVAVPPVGEAETPAPAGAGTPLGAAAPPATDGSDGGAPASAAVRPVPGGTSLNPPGLPAASAGVVPKLTRDGSDSGASRGGQAGPDGGGSASAASPVRPAERSGEPPTHPAGAPRTSPTHSAGPSGMASVRLIEGPSGTSSSTPVHRTPPSAGRIHEAATGSATGTPPGTPTARPTAPPATATASAEFPPAVGVSAGRHRASSPEAPGDTARPGAQEPVPIPGRVPAAVTDAKAGPDAPTSPAPAPASATSPASATGPAPATSPASATGPAPSTAVAERGAPAPDFGRITGARVGTVAVPVAAVVRVARRKNVIGAETTGSIPVHLLFRDEPETVVRRAAGADDGGPDTVAMAAPITQTNGRGPAIPAPSKIQPQTGTATKPVSEPAAKGATKSPTRSTAQAPAMSPSKARPTPKRPQTTKATASTSRPAPTADPGLVERPGAVLPGWVGVIGGAAALAGCAAIVWWTGAVPEEAARMLRLPERPYHGIHLGQWALLALGVVLALFALGGLGRGRVGYAWVLTLFGDYRGTVRRTGLVWVSPLLLRRRVDVRLRHWRSEPLSSVDAKGTALDVTVLVVWRVRDTVRAALGVDGHEDYLREQVEAAMARVLSQLPADAFHEDAPTLRDAEAVGEALTRMLSAECAPVGVDVFSAQPTRIEYAPEVAAAMRRRRIAAIDAKHRDSVLTSVVDAVDDVVHRLTSRGLVELDDYERKALVKDLTVAFYTGRTGPVEGA